MFSLTNAGIMSGDIKVIVFMSCLIALLTAFISFMLSVLNALGIYEMTKTLGIKSKWFAFFPFFRSIAFGKLSDCSKGMANTFFRKTLLLLNILYFSVFVTGICCFLLGFVDTVFAADIILTENGTITTKVLSSLYFPAVVIAVSFFIYLIYRVIYYISFYRILSAFAPSVAVLYTVLAIIFPFLAPVVVFFIRKNKPIFPRREGYNYFVEG